MIADGGYRGTGLVIPHRREPGQAELPAWKEEHNASHRKVRARVEHTFARMKTWKILRDCRLKGDGVHDTSTTPEVFAMIKNQRVSTTLVITTPRAHHTG